MRTNKSGFQRNDDNHNLRYDLIPHFMLERLARLYADGAKKFGERNWQKAHTIEDYVSFEASAFRHFMAYKKGKTDEDHFSRIIFNLVGMEYVKQQNKCK